MSPNDELDERGIAPGVGPVLGRRGNPAFAAAADQRGRDGDRLILTGELDLEAILVNRDALDMLEDERPGWGRRLPGCIGVPAQLVRDHIFEIASWHPVEGKGKPLLVWTAVVVTVVSAVLVGMVGRHATPIAIPQNTGE